MFTMKLTCTSNTGLQCFVHSPRPSISRFSGSRLRNTATAGCCGLRAGAVAEVAVVRRCSWQGRAPATGSLRRPPRCSAAAGRCGDTRNRVHAARCVDRHVLSVQVNDIHAQQMLEYSHPGLRHSSRPHRPRCLGCLQPVRYRPCLANRGSLLHGLGGVGIRLGLAVG